MTAISEGQIYECFLSKTSKRGNFCSLKRIAMF
jgi:hypothetical protein